MKLPSARRAVARRTVPIALLTAAMASAGLVTLATPADAATIGVKPVRTISAEIAISALAVASNGTIYEVEGSTINVWSPASDGDPIVAKSFTGASVTGTPSLSLALGLAYASGSTTSVVVIDPGQAGGPAVPTRTISGAQTQIEDPRAVAWTPSGALWVLDAEVAGNDAFELLRFAPGATGDVAPVRQISGSRTRLRSALDVLTLAGLPNDAVAVSPAGVAPQYSVFGASQSGNAAPTRTVRVQTPGPHWLSQGIAADPQGRVYIGSGDVEGNQFGRLDVFGPTADGAATPLVTLGGTQQRFQVPLLPSVAANGTLALVDATVLFLGPSSQTTAEVQVFRPLFTKPGAVTSLAVKKSSTTATVSWKAGSNPSGTPLTYQVVVRKGTTVLVNKKVSGRSLAIKRSTLPAGSLKVSVTATNVGGTSAAASKAFTR